MREAGACTAHPGEQVVRAFLAPRATAVWTGPPRQLVRLLGDETRELPETVKLLVQIRASGNAPP